MFTRSVHPLLSLTVAAFLALGIASCRAQAEPPTGPVQTDLKKIDIHTHDNYERDFLIPLLDEWRMQVAIVNVARSGDSWREEWEATVAHATKHPDHLFMVSAFDGEGIDQPGYADGVIEQLGQDIERGAVMVKVWKTFGLTTKDAAGNFIQIDDERLQPIWDFLTSKGVPVLAHIGEPRAAWLPLDEESPHYTYYRDNPEFHAYQHPEIPRWETIIAARDHWIERNPDLIIIGAHLGSMAYDVDEVGKRLDRFPNFYVDTAARFGDMTRQPSDKVRDFFILYQDRILYGTDMGIEVPPSKVTAEDQAAERASMEKMLSLHWQYLSGSDSLYFDSPMISSPVNTRGLGLPIEVLQKVYYGNAASILKL